MCNHTRGVVVANGTGQVSLDPAVEEWHSVLTTATSLVIEGAHPGHAVVVAVQAQAGMVDATGGSPTASLASSEREPQDSDVLLEGDPAMNQLGYIGPAAWSPFRAAAPFVPPLPVVTDVVSEGGPIPTAGGSAVIVLGDNLGFKGADGVRVVMDNGRNSLSMPCAVESPQSVLRCTTVAGVGSGYRVRAVVNGVSGVLSDKQATLEYVPGCCYLAEVAT